MRRRPAVIEVVGPAGVGKTTLALALEARGQAARGTMWIVPTRFLAVSTLRQAPTALALYRDTGALLWDEIKHLARLDALHTFIRATHWNGTRLVVLDEGPVYTLSWLQVQGHTRFLRPTPPSWHATVRRWAQTLDAVVVLDAPDAVLTSRIRSRAKPHLMKDRSDEEVAAFVAAYRAASERVLTDLAASNGPPVLRLAMEDDLEQMGDRFLAAIEQEVHAH